MNRYSRRDFLRIGGASAAALAAAPLLEACGSSATTPSPTAVVPKSVPRIRLASSSALFGFPSPFAMTRGPGFVGMSYLFDQLLWDARGGTRPWLAESYQYAPGNTSITFKLRAGATFHDGTPVTAQDVVFSVNLIKAKPMPWTINTGLITNATAVDTHTVTLDLQSPNAVFLNSDMSSLPVLPMHVWQNVSDPYHFMDPTALVGSGPYALQQFDATAGSYQYVAYDGYVQGKPVVREVDYVPVSDVLLGLQSGTIDAGSPNTTQGIGADALAPFKADPKKFGVIDGPGDLMTALYFNLSAGAPYNDVKFRQALAYAINRNDLVTRVLQGSGTPGNPGWLSPHGQWYNAGVPKYAFNLATAKSMLDSAGYTLPAGATVRQGPDGKQLVLPVVFDSSTPTTVQVLQSQLQQVNIQLDPHGLDFASLRSTATQGKYSLAIISLGGLSGDPDFNFQAFNPQAPAAVQNFTYAHGYANQQMATLEAQQRTLLVTSQRKAVVDQMEQTVATDLPALSLYYQPNVWIFNKQVFDAWYFTPGGIAGGNPGTTNKSLFVTGSQ